MNVERKARKSNDNVFPNAMNADLFIKLKYKVKNPYKILNYKLYPFA